MRTTFWIAGLLAAHTAKVTYGIELKAQEVSDLTASDMGLTQTDSKAFIDAATDADLESSVDI